MALVKVAAACAPESHYHFQICSPKPDDDYQASLDHVLKKLSRKAICLDEYEFSNAHGLPVVLVGSHIICNLLSLIN